ncbi:antibiotic biosynthesis monooxygenase [Halobacillus kuroshimensis]|uniref:Antibiotic biosynthesis monooxygenase n=1 Tax=Halobacillus kuroshimensis TaxID=302481 RepID=A0ABS3E0J0_9BACI|nr:MULTISPECIES: putative quinol monooxygenase [Halobacillus]MBN8237118.1 antibiotic biosynthesis monooxygenase [Halobacillus kuroshimensis]
MITINAFLTAKEGREEELFNELKKVIEPSRKEAGCIDYVLHRSLDDASVFAFYETWKDQEALQMHIDSDHYQAYREATKDLTSSREVHKLEKVQ